MVRLKDIAERAGVSIMTVSKALRDAPDISAATRTRLKALAEEMGYVPDSFAQGLRTRSSRLFGLVIPTVTAPVVARMVMAIEEQAHDLGYQLLLCHTLNLPEREVPAIRRLMARRVEGVFIAPAYRLAQTVPVYEELRQTGIPTVILGHHAPFSTAFANVETDDVEGSFAATRHLLDLGHRRILYLAGPPASPWARERFDGYRRALREAGIEPEDGLVFQAGATIEEGEKAALQILGESVQATALQAANDLVAIGAASTLLEHGRRIPGDLSLVGYGDMLMSAYFRIPLTTVHQPKYRAGLAAMELMLQLLRGEKPPTRRMTVELVIRSSTARCGAGRSEPPGVVPTPEPPTSP